MRSLKWCLSVLLSWRPSHLVPVSPKVTLRLISVSHSFMAQALFKLLLLHWVPGWLHKSAHKAFKSRFSIPCSCAVLLNVLPIHFKTKHFGGLSPQCKTHALRCMIWGPNPSLLREKFCTFEIPTTVGCHACEVFSKSFSLPLPFYPLSWRHYTFSFQDIFRGYYSICICGFVLSVGGCKFRISILNRFLYKF